MLTDDTILPSHILAALDAAGVRLYQSTWRAKPVWEAQSHLQGRTHYVDDATLRFHHARVLSCQVFAGGAFLRLRESVSLDMRNTQRGQRYVVFDVFGDVVSRADLDHCSNSERAARKALETWMAGFDPVAHYLAKLARRATMASDRAIRIADALATEDSHA